MTLFICERSPANSPPQCTTTLGRLAELLGLFEKKIFLKGFFSNEPFKNE